MVRLKSRAMAAGIAAFALTPIGLGIAPAWGESDSLKGKTVTMITGDSAGGGTDTTGRLVAIYFSKYLPGKPAVIVRNMPGAGGMTSLNYVTSQTKPDGLTVIMGSTSQADPKNYRKSNSQYDPSTFLYVGGIVRGGYGLLVGVGAEPRLRDKSKPPVIMGSSTGNPRNAMLMTMWGIEYLGWNAKWVTGYPGTNELMLALDRGEIDMTTTGDIGEIGDRVSSGKFKIISQTGNSVGEKVLPRPDFGSSPVFDTLMAGKLSDALAEKAFDYWLAINAVDKYVALAPGTSDETHKVYVAAFEKASHDPDFIAQGKTFSDQFVPVAGKDIDRRIKVLANTPPEAIDYIKVLLRKQGLKVE
jgi:tripartite-type tricarboxylate transporter receptor subunit TctC